MSRPGSELAGGFFAEDEFRIGQDAVERHLDAVVEAARSLRPCW